MILIRRLSLYLTRKEYQEFFKPTFLENAKTHSQATVVILDYLSEYVKKSLYVQDASYIEALMSDGSVVRKVGWKDIETWLTTNDIYVE